MGWCDVKVKWAMVDTSMVSADESWCAGLGGGGARTGHEGSRSMLVGGCGKCRGRKEHEERERDVVRHADHGRKYLHFAGKVGGITRDN